VESIPGTESVVGDFVVGPGKVDLTIEPGQLRTIQMTVTNRTGELRRFNIETEDAEGTDDIQQPIRLLGDDRGPYSIKDYLSFPHASFELAHNQRAIIPVTISIPEDAEPGGLYGSVLVNTISVEAEPGDTLGTVPQSAIIARIGTLFFVTVPGDVLHEGALLNFSTVPEQSYFQSGPIHFGILFENTGVIHLAPYGELRITNLLGEEVGWVELDPWFILPNSLRLREVTWDREWLFGRYTATVNINRSYDDVIDTMEYTFWVLPWKVIAVVFSVLFIIIFLFRAFFRKFEFRRK
jgi:hypothetical protein